MNKIPDFIHAGEKFHRAVTDGLAQGAATLADALRARGLRTEVQSTGDGGARLVIEGTGIVAREFGSLNREAQPIVAPVVRAHAQEIVRLIAAEIAKNAGDAS